MEKKDSSTTVVGVGFCDLLALLFIALKLMGVINWSWIWVLAPIWIPIAIATAILLFYGLLILLIKLKN